MAEKKRLDKTGRRLYKGENQQKDGRYRYRWTDKGGRRHTIYADTLEILRSREDDITRDRLDKINTDKEFQTVNDVFDRWIDDKVGLRDTTNTNYRYMYNQFVRDDIGKKILTQVTKSMVKNFYNRLATQSGLKVATIDNIHTVLHQVFACAVDDDYIRKNPSDGCLTELKRSHNFDTEKKRALTVEEQNLFLDYLKESEQYGHWYPIFCVMLGTGLRVGEVTGLRWKDVDEANGEVRVRQNLVYYNHRTDGCYFSVHTPKTDAGVREIQMFDTVKEAFKMERKAQKENNTVCKVTIDGYTDFVFVNRFGNAQHQGTLNKALRRIIRDCNDEILLRDPNAKVLLPKFSCHTLRHTFATRMVENDMNPKALQAIMGHKDIETTMNIYADATKGFKKQQMEKVAKAMKEKSVAIA